MVCPSKLFAKSSGNVLEDLPVKIPADALAKSELAALIVRALRARALVWIQKATWCQPELVSVMETAVAGR